MKRPSEEPGAATAVSHTDIAVTALDHLYVAVTDIERSEAFYDGVMRLLGFRKGTKPIAGERHLHYFNPVTQYSIRPARTGSRAHDSYAPGLHHVCFRVGTNAEVDAAAQGLRALGVPASAPGYYPEYAEDYYATFFRDPDGIRLEVVAQRRMRTLIRDHWNELTEFENPLAKAGLA
jgi:catechol 2,3-dioxygenase-like lactoylglutathione lyase family enzyme